MSGQPMLPPRPARSQGASSLFSPDVPQIPPRPNRSTERSVSPSREQFTRSPLNEPPVSLHNNKFYSQSNNLSASDLPRRPPSVSLPSIGQEGSEYASMDAGEESNANGLQEHTINVAPDLPMHAPKASVPQSTATTRIATVTRTDSSQAAAAGIGKARHEDELKDSGVYSLRAKASFNRSSASLPRPASIHEGEHDHGIPSFGMQVPMYPNAGDVQAPSPAPSAQPHTPGIGFFNDGSQAPSRNHVRKRSSRTDFGPPGSYGMHGHGHRPKDQFEHAWYQKHPEALDKEIHRQYDPGHPQHDWALSSDDLNKLVRQSSREPVGMGTNREMMSTPSEQIGFKASEEYASRMTSPMPGSGTLRPKRPSSSSAHADSPLRTASFPHHETAHLRDGAHDHAIDDDLDDNVIHINPPSRRGSKVGGGGYDPPTEDLGPHGGNTAEEGGWIEERGYGVPILASDEIAKHPGSEYMQPAIDPEQERRGSDYYAGIDSENPPSYQSGRRGSSKGASRPNSMHGEPLARFMSREAHDGSGIGTPLEEIEEYEPLFPEDDEKSTKPVTTADKLRRPDLARHHFPSQDVWEDTPTSLQLQTTVDTPQMPEDREPLSAVDGASASQVFESPDVEMNRKEGNIPSDRIQYLPDSSMKFAKPMFKAGVAGEMLPPRPSFQRFPSRDIWEDTPDSLRLETTVDTPQTEQSPVVSSPEVKMKPQLPSRPAVRQPEIPARPPQRQNKSPLADSQLPSVPGAFPTDRQVPSLPDRPKPQVPARPVREVQDGGSLSKVTSPESVSTSTSPPMAKAKPVVPARPAGNKLAALKSGFMNDLNSRLQLGPQAPKAQAPAEEEAAAVEEKTPLTDARKGRARGPVRRKPAATETGVTEAASGTGLSFSSPRTLFHIDEDSVLQVPSHGTSYGSAANETSSALDDAKAALSGTTAQAIGAEGDFPDPHIAQGTLDRGQAIQPSLAAALADSDAAASTSFTSATTEPIAEAEAQAPAQSEMTDSAAQTGQTDVSMTAPSGEKESFTTFLGGRAEPEGNVIVRDGGEEIVGEVAEDTPRRMQMTGGN